MSTAVTTTTEVRLSYTNLLAPRAQNAEKPEELTYSTAILIPKSDKATIAAMKKAIDEALADGVAKKWAGKKPNGLKYPLRDGDADRPDDENYAGMMFMNAKGPSGGAKKPFLFDKDGRETESESDIYSGVYGRVSVQFYAFDKNGSKGVAAGITALQSSGKGEPLGSVVTVDSAREMFGITTPAGEARSQFTSNKESDAEATESGAEADPWG